MATYKPVGIDEAGLLPPRARTALQTRYHAEDSTNLVDDPYCLGDIEDELGWRVAGSGWVLGPSQDGTRRSLQMTGETLGAPYTRAHNKNISPVTPGERIDVSFLGRNTANGQIWMQLQFLDSNRSTPVFGDQIAVLTNTTEWTEFAQSFVIPPDKYHVVLTFQTRNISTGFAEITQVSMTKRIDADQVAGIEDTVQAYLESEGYTPFDSSLPAQETWPTDPGGNSTPGSMTTKPYTKVINLYGNGNPIDVGWQGFGVSFASPIQHAFLNPRFTRKRKEIMRILYSKGWGTGETGQRGIGLDIARVYIGASTVIPSEDNPGTWNTPSTFQPTKNEVYWDRDKGQEDGIAHAHRYNPNLKVMASIWSPPAWMKTNGNVNGSDNGTLDDSYINHYAAYLSSYVWRHNGSDWDNGRFKINYISIFNEPHIKGFDQNAYIDPQKYADTLQAVGSKFFVDGHDDVELIGPEESSITETRDTTRFLALETSENPTGWYYLDAIATHYYGAISSRKERAGSSMRWMVDNWDTVKPSGLNTRRLYQTETTQYYASYEDFMDLAENIHLWIHKLQASMFLYWWALDWVSNNDLLGEESLMGSTEKGSYYPNKKLSVLGQYSRFVDPGYKIMQLSGDISSDHNIWSSNEFYATAFLCRDGNHTRTIIVNRKKDNHKASPSTSGEQVVRVWGVKSSAVEVWITSEASYDNLRPLGAKSTAGSSGSRYVDIVIPANSVVTISDRGNCTA